MPQHRLARPLAQWSPPALIEHLVIGSGYGGAVAARRWAEAGRAVVVLERGSEFVPGEFPNDIALLPKFLRGPAGGPANGLFEWHLGAGVTSLTANGLGGGSLINAGVLFEPDDDVLRQAAWPAELRHEAEPPAATVPQQATDARTLRGAMRLARRTLGGHSWPDGYALAKTRALSRTAAFLQPGAAAQAVHLTIDPAQCTRCGDCCSGCNVPGAKLTLRGSYLAAATAAGATLVCGATAWRIEPLADAQTIDSLPAGAARWAVTVLATERIGRDGRAAVMAGRPAQHRRLLVHELTLAAGTFGSTELLQRSARLAGQAFVLSPTLGSRFSGNGDALAFAADMPERVAAEGRGALPLAPTIAERCGPTITAAIDLRRHTTGPRAGQLKPIAERLLVEDGATPGAIVRAAREMLALQYTLAQLEAPRSRQARQARLARHGAGQDALAAGELGAHTQLLLAMGHDDSPGYLVHLPALDRSVPVWPGDPGTATPYRQQAEAWRGLEDMGAVHLHPPTWQLLPPSAGAAMSGPGAPRLLLTVHPLGGCPMGANFASGVVDHRGRVWREDGRLWPGLAVLDGSIVPTSLGVNPLLTITALAERALALAGQPDDVPADLPADTDGHDTSGGTSERRAAQTAPEASAAPPAFEAPRAFSRHAVPRFDVSLLERLSCAAGRLHTHDGRALHAEAHIELGADDWLPVWDEDRTHRVTLRRGRLRLQSPVATAADTASPSSPPTREYTMHAGWFELLPQHPRVPFEVPARPSRDQRRSDHTLVRAWRERWRQLREAAQAARVLLSPTLWLTWLAHRGLDDMARASNSPPRERPLRQLGMLLKGLAHAAEKRRMRYCIELVLPPDASTGAGLGAGPVVSPAPARLLLIGHKDVQYAATPAQLWRWWRQRAAVRAAGHPGQGLPPPRPSWWAQVSNPQMVLLDATRPAWQRWIAERWPAAPLFGAWAWGPFELDASQLLAQTPLALHRGDLTSGIEAQSAYAGLFLRHALKTHLNHFRLPDYSGNAVADLRGSADTLRVHGHSVQPHHHALRVRRGRSAGEPPGSDELPAALTLDLWHYARPAASPAEAAPMLEAGSWYGHPVRRARCVLLVHAFGQSGAMFTLPGTAQATQPSLARTLLEQGFDVWVLDHRISTRLPYTEWPSTIDQIARFDIPAAVATIQQQLHKAHGDGAPLQIFAFGQCVGGAALSMALLDGRLSHGIVAPSGNEAPGALMPQLAGAVISQTHPFLVATATTRAKTWLPRTLSTLLGWRSVPLAVRGPVHSLCEAWIDRLFASLPVPADEHCPHERNAGRPQDDCATCRRIRFFEAPLFKHHNLSGDVHALLPRLFGNANLHLFAHAARCVEHERLVDNDGRGAYVRDDRWRQHMGLPLVFLHGRENELFHVSSARRSAAEHARLFPDMARRVAEALGRPVGPQAPLAQAAAWVLEGFGHVDPVLGHAAPARVFMPMAAMFNTLMKDASTVPTRAPRLAIACTAVMPRCGPWVGHLEALLGGRLRVHVAFLLDDRSSAGSFGGAGAPGTRSWAFVRVRGAGSGAGAGAAATLHRLEIKDFHRRDEVLPPCTQGDAPRAAEVQQVGGYRIAHGVVEVVHPGPGVALELQAFSVHELLLAHAEEHPQGLPRGALLAPAELASKHTPGALDAWLAALLDAHTDATQHAARRRNWLDPAWRQAGTQAGERLDALQARHAAAHIPAAVLQALPATDSFDSVEFAAASCRYPGMAVDSARVDESARTLLDCAASPQPGRPQPGFALLLGDQIYADATAGIVDPLNPVERFVERHRRAFQRGRPDAFGQPQATLGDLLATLPTYLTQDDHELRDGWPGAGPIGNGLAPGRAREQHLVHAALEAVQAFQRQHMPLRRFGDGGSYAFVQGAVRFFVLDSRTERRVDRDGRPRVTLYPPTWQALQDWWAEDDGRLACLVSGTVMLPRLVPGNNPANPGDDGFDWCGQDREDLLAHLRAAAARGRPFLLLAGDYHLSAALCIEDAAQAGRTVGAAVVAPAAYAPLPYTNATREALWMNEPLQGLTLRDAGRWEGSGFVSLRVERRAERCFNVTLRHWLRDHAQAEPAGRFTEPLTITIGDTPSLESPA